MATIIPFRAVRPKPEYAAQVAAPPYDVVSLDEARNIADGNPYCFLRVGRAELELADGIDPYSMEIYERGAANLRGTGLFVSNLGERKFLEDGILVREAHPMFGVYRQRWETHEQTGLVALASIDEYDRGIVKKHELTKPVKEEDRVRVIETHESQSGPVLLFFRRTAQFENWLTDITAVTEPDFQFTADNGVEHTVWSLRDHVAIEKTRWSKISRTLTRCTLPMGTIALPLPAGYTLHGPIMTHGHPGIVKKDFCVSSFRTTNYKSCPIIAWCVT